MRRNLLRAARFTILGLAAAAFLTLPARAGTQTFDRTVPLREGGRFSIDNVNGSVEVEGWEQQAVEIHAIKVARRRASDLALVNIEIEADPSSVSVHTRYPQGDGVEVVVQYRVRVPYHVVLALVSTVNGNVHVRGVDATGQVRSVNGDAEVLDSAGRLSVQTTNGNVRLDLRRLDDGAPLLLSTVNGAVVLALPPGSDADLQVRSLNGNFRSDLPLSTKSSLHALSFRARLGAGGGVIELRTINGGIRLVAEQPST
ncbi:MAG: DUF4097 family beta strand repeat-containing protein [Steroidobacteraceae bacterium]